MANTQAIKKRIKSVKSTKQITKAMELVAASKMRKAQEATLKSRAYRNTAREILTRINQIMDVSAHPLYAERDVSKRLYVLITSDRGLAGAYNANILKLFTKEVRANDEAGIASQVIIIGKQGANFASKVENLDVLAVYENFADNPTANDIKPILDTVMAEFTPVAPDVDPEDIDIDELRQAAKKGSQANVDEVIVLFTDFVSSITQVASTQTILPAAFQPAESPADLPATEGADEVPIEPDPKTVVDVITPRLVEVQLFQAILESQASEHVSRMMAMKNASDNASDLIDDLTLEFNSARQAAITQELAEISAGAEAIS